MINMDNYEGYLYLYQEGELDSTTRTEVERFLLEHPDIREEMETYYDPPLWSPPSLLPAKPAALYPCGVGLLQPVLYLLWDMGYGQQRQPLSEQAMSHWWQKTNLYKYKTSRSHPTLLRQTKAPPSPPLLLPIGASKG